ncbi:DUF4157 domain-containing protein [Streptomyces sp. NPDC048278]|uniref:eCIS core domain-containing protein n=1 Tax=Streptomyces sp. NPDC048278 TaxID=3155809 RepID=UPI003415A669
MHLHASHRPSADRGATAPSRPSGALPALLALQRAAGNAAVTRAIQRDRHAHGPGCGHQDEEAVQRSAVTEAVRSAGSPLDPRIRAKAEPWLGMDLGAVRVHTDPVAQRSAVKFGARAYTTGADIVVGPQGADDETMYHELTHVRHQATGTVAGTDNGAGVRVSDPGDPFEKHAAESGRKMAQGVAPDLTVHGAGGHGDGVQRAAAAPAVQRYQIIEPGGEGYPTTHPNPKDENFFVHQEENEAGSWYDKHSPPEPHLVYSGAVRLAVSDDFSLAVQHTDGSVEPKTFFATERQINAANKRLPGRSQGRGIALSKTSRYLQFEGMGRKEVLWEVQPKARHEKKGDKQKGLDVRTPQRCNRMAEFVTGAGSLASTADQAYWRTLGQALDLLVPGKAFEKTMTSYLDEEDVEGYRSLSSTMSRSFQDLVAQRADEVEAVLARLEINQHAPIPRVGEAMVSMAFGDHEQDEQRKKAAPGEFIPYHFGGVVAVAGHDYITMEDYAREQPQGGTSTLDRGDPLWYFRMYEKKSPHSWHEMWASPGRTQLLGATLTITLR